MRVLLFRSKLDLNSGAAQLIRMQAAGLRKAGVHVTVGAERGALKFLLRTGISARRIRRADVRERARVGRAFVVDHSMTIPEAQLVFVHNAAAAEARFVARDDGETRVASERRFFDELAVTAGVVANSELVKSALVAQFGIEAERIAVQYPGFQAARFRADRVAHLRRRARLDLGVNAAEPLFGFVTSGDLVKRGLDLFIESAVRICQELPAARFLVVGARSLPEWARQHWLVKTGRLLYRPKNHAPEKWIGALDVFLYAARFEEFGMVVLEALALGVPVLTSRRVGAAECLPESYAAWLTDEPNADVFARAALRLWGDPEMRVRLAAAGTATSADFTDLRYAERTAAAILRSCGSSKR